ncbi:hypothetical protein HOK09_04590 [Candidatus Woesearchaeota archaeon]|jgi:hypothetical protein|nr:hypothetical protein [Candidatus Woesearchaeota archaeon]
MKIKRITYSKDTIDSVLDHMLELYEVSLRNPDLKLTYGIQRMYEELTKRYEKYDEKVIKIY